MPVEVEWDDEAHTILIVRTLRPWTWEEFFQASGQAQALTDNSPHKVYSISDARNAGPMPQGAIAQFRRAVKSLAPQTGGTVIVGATSLVRVIIDLFQRMNIPIARQWTTANSVEEAREIIARWKAQETARDEGTEAGN